MQSLVEIGPVVFKKKILNIANVFSLFRNHLPECFVPCLVEIGPEMIMRKVYYDDDNDNKDRQRSNFDQKTHLTLWFR